MNDLYNKFCINCIYDFNKDSEPVCEILIESFKKDIRDINNTDLVKVGNYVIECKKYQRRNSNVGV